MALLSTLVAFGLRQASIESGEKIVEKFRDWMNDPSLDLHKAIKKANDRTWYAVTLALGGEGWTDKLRGLFHGADVRGMRDQIQSFLRHAWVGAGDLPHVFKKRCLDELKQLKAAGKLSAEAFDPTLVTIRIRDFRRYDDPGAMAQEARRVCQQLAVDIVLDAPNLAELLQLPLAGENKPLLVTAFSFFLRQEISERPQLAQHMLLDTTERMYAAQADGFVALESFLGGMDNHLHQFYELVVLEFDDMRGDISGTRRAADDASRNVNLMLDLIREHQDRDRERQEQDRKEQADLRHLVQLLMDTVNQIRGGSSQVPHTPISRTGPSQRERPFVDHDHEDERDRAAVEELLAQSPLTSQVRDMMSLALNDEIEARRASRRGGRAPGTRKEGPLGMALVWIPPGSFFMGSPTTEPHRDEDEFPHRVTLSNGLWMSAHPITRAQWWRLMRSIPDDGPKDDHPVEGVSWHETEDFLDRLTWETLGLYRLPTEAEWEYACRAGSVTPFCYGFRLSSLQANFHGTATAGDELTAPPLSPPQGTTIVGTFPPNAWGLYDMHGNVMEWCQDWYAPYELQDVYDPQGPQDGETKVLRGGGWWSPAHACRSARRSAARSDATVLPAGFRIVLLDRE